MAIAHAKLGASSAHRWMACPGSVALSDKAPPQQESVAAREGTIAHELAAYCLTNGLYDAADAVDSVPVLAELDKLFPGQGDAKRKEMLAGVNEYLAAVYDVHTSEQAGSALYVETKFNLDHVGPDMFGTCDAVVLIPSQRKLVVFDLKYGAGTPVSVRGNPQLQYYALGALRVFQGPGYEGLKIRDVEIVICQPRAGGTKREALDRADLFEFKARLAEAANAARQPNAPLVDGPHCKFCPAKIICPQLTAAAAQAARDDFGAVPGAAGFSPEDMGKRLRIAATAEMWAKAVREYAVAEANAGRMPAGFQWVQGRAGNREWATGVDEAALKKAVGNLAPVTETRLLSPAALEKELGKPEFKSRCEALTYRKPPGQTLAPIGDGRPTAADYAIEGF